VHKSLSYRTFQGRFRKADTKTLPESDPRYHLANIEKILNDLAEHARQDISKVHDSPRAEALFETTAEVLLGLAKAYRDAQNKSEEAWR